MYNLWKGKKKSWVKNTNPDENEQNVQNLTHLKIIFLLISCQLHCFGKYYFLQMTEKPNVSSVINKPYFILYQKTDMI